MVCALLANIYRDKEKRAEPFEPADFLPGEPQKQPQGMTREQWINAGKVWRAAYGVIE